MSDPKNELMQWLRTLNHGKEGSRAEGLLNAALSRARAEALEEAAKVADEEGAKWGDLKNRTTANDVATRIRALITTPAPATIPVERVREVLLTRRSDRRRITDRGAVVREIARDLGVDLDTKGEALTICEHNSGRPHQWSRPTIGRPQCIFCEALKP